MLLVVGQLTFMDSIPGETELIHNTVQAYLCFRNEKIFCSINAEEGLTKFVA